jgi:signal transduction histidine kinase
MNVSFANSRWVKGTGLWLPRIGWLAIFLLITSMYATNLPHVYQDTFNEWQVGEALSAALRLFPSKHFFVQAIIVLRLVTATIFIGTALFLTWHRSNNWFVLFLSATLLMLSFMFGYNFDVSIVRYPYWLVQIFPPIRVIAPSLLAIGMVLLFFLFPNGRFIPRWTVWLVLPATAMILLFFAEAFYGSWNDPTDRLLPEEAGWRIFIYTLIGTAMAGLIGQISRYRKNSSQEQRQQTKWVLLGLSSLILVPMFEWGIFELFLGNWIDYSFRMLVSLLSGILVPILLPLTIAISIFRHRLWDVDLFINRALVYGTLTTVIVALYGLSVGLVSTLIPSENRWPISTLALVIALLLVAPLRVRVQGLADRLLPPSRTEIVEEAPIESPATAWPLRLAHLAWIVTLIFLSGQVIIRLTSQPDLILATGGDFLVMESLKLPALTAGFFIPYVLALRVGVTAVFWSAAGLIFWHKRQNGFALFVSFIFMITPFGLVFSGVDTPITNILSMLGLLTIALFPFFFPDGQLIPRSFRWRAAVIIVLLITPILVYPIAKSAYPEYSPGEWAYASAMVTMLVFMTAGFTSQVFRYRHIATAIQRQQTKWILLGLEIQLLWIAWLVLWLSRILSYVGLTEPVIALIMLHLTILGNAALPVTIGLSILRYRLWDIDLLINRSLVFGGLTLLIAAAYVIVVGVLGALFQAGENVLLSILATGLIAILFHPLRQRLQHLVNRLMYGDRDDPATVLSQLTERLANTAVPGEVIPNIVETIAQTLKLPYVAILQAKTRGEKAEIVAEYGQPVPAAAAYPLVYQHQTIGQLWVAPRAPDEPFTQAEKRLLENIAQQAGAAVYTAQLTRHLQHSRQQLVTSREEERRRIRRDLHDGLGPQLATMSLKLDATSNCLENNPKTAEQLLQELKNQIQDAIQDIRRLVYDLRPPALDQLGLAPALREYAAQNSVKGLQITINAPERMPPLPAAVEVAAYRIILEALTNTVRHANANQCTVKLNVEEDLFLEILDDGVGFPAHTPFGVGFSSMQERTSELGGTFELHSNPGAGTRLFIRLPLAKP